ncbi:MAG: DinB family protein [Actinobacteria bacterium]|nr:DinB family protein [Actinomycetota bacterium]
MELEAFTAESEAVDRTLADVPDDAWARPALGVWNLAELVAHLVRGAGRVHAYLDRDPGGDAPACDRVGYYRVGGGADESQAVARRARELAAATRPGDLPAAFAGAWRQSAARAADLPPDRLIATAHGPMRLREYLATRVLETTVHHLDVLRALERPPVATPAAGRLTMALLEGLLGDRRPRNFGRMRFIMAATGRLEVDDPRMPVLR